MQAISFSYQKYAVMSNAYDIYKITDTINDYNTRSHSLNKAHNYYNNFH